MDPLDQFRLDFPGWRIIAGERRLIGINDGLKLSLEADDLNEMAVCIRETMNLIAGDEDAEYRRQFETFYRHDVRDNSGISVPWGHSWLESRWKFWKAAWAAGRLVQGRTSNTVEKP